MIRISNDFKPQYTSEKPIRVIPIGSIQGIYLPKLFVQSFIFDKKITFPAIVEHQGKMKIAFFFSKPLEYSEKCYRVYKLKRKTGICTYLPIPKYLHPILIKSAHKQSLITYSIGFHSNGLVILLEEL